MWHYGTFRDISAWAARPLCVSSAAGASPSTPYRVQGTLVYRFHMILILRFTLTLALSHDGKGNMLVGLCCWSHGLLLLLAGVTFYLTFPDIL